MTTVHLKLEELAPVFRRMGARTVAAAKRGALRGALRAVSTLQRATSMATPANPKQIGVGGAVNTAHYKRSWKAEQLPDGARVYNSAPYAGVIEHGRRAGSFPPLREIERWAQRRMGLNPKEAKAAAFPIARAIARRGLLARKVMGNAQAEIEQGFLEEVRKELERELARGPVV
jgi:hypothetical protein